MLRLPTVLLLASAWVHAQAALFPGAKPVVLIFVRTDCPVSNRYAPEIGRLASKYTEFDWYLVYPDRRETMESIRNHLSRYAFGVKPLRDPEMKLARMAHAIATPEAAVFARDGTLEYHGRIDNRYVDFGKVRSAATQQDLEVALKAVMSGRAPETPVTRAVGCSLADLE